MTIVNIRDTGRNSAKTSDVHVWSDGTNWYLDGMCKVQDGITTTQAS